MAPEFYKDLVVHDSWLKLMYDFVMDPKMSLRSRIKRKVADASEFHFYGVGVYASSHVYVFFQSVSCCRTVPMMASDLLATIAHAVVVRLLS